MAKDNIYDLIIVGAGAAGLFAGASLPSFVKDKKLKVLILEKKSRPGLKLLTTGGGQCNLTNTANIKDFVNRYGQNGKNIRSVLYKFNNLALMEFFESKGLPLTTIDTGQVYPKSLKSRDVLDLLVNSCRANGLEMRYSSSVIGISKVDQAYSIQCLSKDSKSEEVSYLAKNVLLTTGGASFPTTGSAGDLFPILEKLGLKIIKPRPALSPIYVENYPFAPLTGIGIEDVAFTVNSIATDKPVPQVQRGDLLFTHDCFSGPVALNSARYAEPGTRLSINYLGLLSKEGLTQVFKQHFDGSKLQIDTAFYQALNTFKLFPKSFCKALLDRTNIDPKKRADQVSKVELNILLDLVLKDTFSISGTKGFKTAMATAGGVSLDEIDMKTMEAIHHPGLYFAGEILDVDGDTGGYNLQFAFSSAYQAMTRRRQKNE